MNKEQKLRLESDMTEIYRQSLRHFFEVNKIEFNVSAYIITASRVNGFYPPKEPFREESVRLYFPIKYTTFQYAFHRAPEFFYVVFQPELEQPFLTLWHSQLQNDEQKKEFLIMSQKVVGLKACVDFFKQDKILFNAFFHADNRNYIGTPANIDFLHLLETAFNLLSEQEFFDGLKTYTKNHKVFFKRVEALSILKDYVQRLSQEKQEAFDEILSDLNSDNYIISPFQTWGIVLNKRALFANIYNEKLTNKYQITEFLTQLVGIFSNPIEGQQLNERLKLKHVFLETDNTKCPYYTLVLCGQSQTLCDYEQLFTQLIDSGIHSWLIDRQTLASSLNAIMNKYFLDLKLSASSTEMVRGEKSKKFKI